MINGCWGNFKGVKCLGCDSDQAPPSKTKVKNEWNYTSASHIYQHGVDRDKCSSNIYSSSSSGGGGVVIASLERIAQISHSLLY